MTTIRLGCEWTAAPLRLVARWAPVRDDDGRTRLEMTWAVPAVELPPESTAA